MRPSENSLSAPRFFRRPQRPSENASLTRQIDPSSESTDNPPRLKTIRTCFQTASKHKEAV
ncbi:hypothetical protein HMPREF9123_1946 [Neisseria bacilliformis ATCC BAA-1200]|uniref:Uncharacterized protein n=1 Tax=Neisseria bacilliformis ATCC BAA-1200 TaxID=888742 RepID=F2BDZ0_9NEIS|nr:hypothetical protein HMPREF9123_1946 [Neisseria bacilliformis ATCC BAA-1200]